MSPHPQPAADRLTLGELEAQVDAFSPLGTEEVAALLDDVRAGGSPSRQRLVQHHLGIALDEARRRGERGVEVGDLFQEATLAVIAAVHEFALREGPPAELAAFTRRVVAAHLDATVEAAELEHRSEEALVRDAQLLEAAEVGLRRRLGRTATPTELASILEWPAERVELMAAMLASARDLYDSDIALYLDDDQEPRPTRSRS